MTTHEPRTWPGLFAAVLDGTKTHEIRVADRPYAVGDVLHLREWDPCSTCSALGDCCCDSAGGVYTGRSIDVRVTYLTLGERGLPAGLCVMSIQKVESQPTALELLQAKETELRSLCGELLESLRLASTTSDGYRDAHMAYQRWAARLAPEAIGDEAKRAAIEAVMTAIPRASTSVLDEMIASLEAKAVPMIDVEIPASLLRALSEEDDEYTAPDRPPLTDEHRAALRTLLVDAEDDLVQLEHLAKSRDVSHTLALARAQVAALRVVLGEEPTL